MFRPPPKAQAASERWSLVFFTRPSNDVQLRALTEQSRLIAEAVARSPDPSKFNTGQTAQSWYYRRTKYQRVKNRTVRGSHIIMECLIDDFLVLRDRRAGT